MGRCVQYLVEVREAVVHSRFLLSHGFGFYAVGVMPDSRLVSYVERMGG